MDKAYITSKFTHLILNYRIRFLSYLCLGSIFAAFSLLLCGCASVSVGNIHAKGSAPKKLPAKIYVEEFAAPYDNFRVDRGGRDLEAFIKEEKHALASNLVAQLTKYIAPAEIAPQGTALPKGNYWLVTGTYSQVNQGSRALRMIVGFGAGGTKMETRVRISDLSETGAPAFLTLLTTGGSGLAPGAWAAFTPAMVFFWPGAVANAGGASLSGVSMDRTRTAREITATLSEYCFQRGLITESRTHRPKKLGQFPPIQRPDFVIPSSGP